MRSELARRHARLTTGLLAQGSPHGFCRHHQTENPVIARWEPQSSSEPSFVLYKGMTDLACSGSVFNYRGCGVLLVIHARRPG